MTKAHIAIRRQLSDVVTVVRSIEINRAFSNVSLVELISEQVARNGETTSASQNATSGEPTAQSQVASARPINATNFLSGSDTSLPTRIERLVQLQTGLSDLITSIKAIEPSSLVEDVAEDPLLNDTITTAEEFEARQ